MSDTKQIDDGGPAFPVTGHCVDASGAYCGDVVNSKGLSLRDWFAGQALAGLLATPGGATAEQCLRYGIDPKSKTAQADLYAVTAYAYAKAMIAARKEK